MVVDTSIWLEIFFDGALKKSCEDILNGKDIIIPSVVIFELYRKIKKQITEDGAIAAVGSLSKYQIQNVDQEIAILAGDLSLEFDLGMADAMILAFAKANDTELLTLDNDFNSIPGVHILRD